MPENKTDISMDSRKFPCIHRDVRLCSNTEAMDVQQLELVHGVDVLGPKTKAGKIVNI